MGRIFHYWLRLSNKFSCNRFFAIGILEKPQQRGSRWLFLGRLSEPPLESSIARERISTNDAFHASFIEIEVEGVHGVIVIPHWAGSSWYWYNPFHRVWLFSKIVLAIKGRLFFSEWVKPAWTLEVAEVGPRHSKQYKFYFCCHPFQ